MAKKKVKELVINERVIAAILETLTLAETLIPLSHEKLSFNTNRLAIEHWLTTGELPE